MIERLAGALVAAVMVVALAGPATAQSARVEVGVLNCSGEGGVGLILGSRKTFACRFEGLGDDRIELYDATITKIGLDIGITGETQIVWTVLAATTEFDQGALRGDYVGASADAAIGVGGGANVLVGGFDNSFALQPLSVQGQEGFNLALGVSGLSLR